MRLGRGMQSASDTLGALISPQSQWPKTGLEMAEINCSQGFDTIILIQTGLLFERRLPWILLAETYQDIKQHLVNKLRVSVVVKITLIFVRINKIGGGDININKKLMRGQDGMSFLFPPTFCLWRSCATSSGELMSTESWSGGLISVIKAT